MKYIETKLDHLGAIDGEVEIAQTPPDGSGLPCLKIGGTFIMPFVGWMKFDTSTETWIELEMDEEETTINTLSEGRVLHEISKKEAGEKFSDDIEFIE